MPKKKEKRPQTTAQQLSSLIKNNQGKTAWIPKYWVIKKKELSQHSWQIVIKKQHWEGKFPEKPE